MVRLCEPQAVASFSHWDQKLNVTKLLDYSLLQKMFQEENSSGFIDACSGDRYEWIASWVGGCIGSDAKFLNLGTGKKRQREGVFSGKLENIWKIALTDQAILDNTFIEFHNSSTFLPKHAMYYDILFSFHTLAAVLTILAALNAHPATMKFSNKECNRLKEQGRENM